MPNSVTSSQPKGLTLVEVIVALGLFAAAIAVFGESCYNAIRALEAVERDETIEEDVQFVRQQILSIGQRDKFEAGGSIETLGSGPADWSAHLEDTDMLDVMKAEVEIQLPNANPQAYQDNVTYYLFRMGWMDPAKRQEIIDRRKAEEASGHSSSGGISFG